MTQLCIFSIKSFKFLSAVELGHKIMFFFGKQIFKCLTLPFTQGLFKSVIPLFPISIRGSIGFK